MKKLKTIMLICLSLLFLGMVFIAVSLAVYVPGASQEKNGMVVMLLFLSVHSSPAGSPLPDGHGLVREAIRTSMPHVIN